MSLLQLFRSTFIAVMLLIAVTASAQTKSAKSTPVVAPVTSAEPVPSTDVDVVYTGKLLGYYRVPSFQNIAEVNGCPDPDKLEPSEAAKIFLNVRKLQQLTGMKTVLVGTGDNFSPELEARVFKLPESDNSSASYKPGNKELYLGSTSRWVPYDERSAEKDALRRKIAEGNGTIPNDNVGCFLRRAGYLAVVPGKHDFYFGVERVRQFARFLAQPPTPNPQNPASPYYEPVTMLGANLVMKTAPIKTSTVSDKVKDERTFVDWPTTLPILNLSDGKTVYPWFSVIQIELADIPQEASFLEDFKEKFRTKQPVEEGVLRAFVKDELAIVDGNIKNKNADNTLETDVRTAQVQQLTSDQKRLTSIETNLNEIQKPIKICLTDGTPNEFSEVAKGNCDSPEASELRIVNNKVLLYTYLKPRFRGANNYSTLEYGKNYLLCLDQPDGKKKDNCMRFSTHTPFFYFPHKVPNEVGNTNGYTEPEPFVLKNNVAIFGVVDPTLCEQVGILNCGWSQRDRSDLTTKLSIEDPVDALQQQLDYFEKKYPDFKGLKILLAQMTPQRARALAASFPDFQIVVAEADQELATSNVKMSTTWKPETRAVLAVPAPYFNPKNRTEAVQYGIINARKDVTEEKNWELSAVPKAGEPLKVTYDEAPTLWSQIKKLPECLPLKPAPNATANYDNQTYLKWLVLCSMQQHFGSDVALIQTRDLFEKIPSLDNKRIIRSDAKTALPGQKSLAVLNENLQQTLDRLIWKGDLATLVYVPGSALKQALIQSTKFANEEKQKLALSVDTGRKLETLGIRTNSNGEYFINELPLDDNRLYAVATTDYIGAGDTGYPDLISTARNPRTHPAAFTGELISISSLVCKKLLSNPADKDKYCLRPVDAPQYLDETIAEQIPPYPPESRFSKLWSATDIKLPAQRTTSQDPADLIEQRVQRRSFWAFSLKNFSLGFKDLDNNRTDQSVKDKFAGVSNASSSKESRTISVGLDSRLSRFADHNEFFLGLGIDYERQAQGDPTKATGISLNKNRVFSDLGLVWWRRPGRDLPNIGAVVSLHGETQLEQPFSAFNLNTAQAEQIRITQKRGALVLSRVGLRWQNKTNAAEFGAQAGRELRALRGYHFENPGDNDPECLVSSAETLSDCIATKSKPPGASILPTSVPSALSQGRPRAGIYWTHSFSFPLGKKMKYEVTQDADFFFVKFHRDTTIDTRFRYNSKNSLKFTIWQNFSIGPTLELFMYQNKMNRSFLFQRQIGIETKLNFDIFNRREKKAQIINK